MTGKDAQVDHEIGAINSQRINWLLLVMAIVHLAHLVIFWPRGPVPPDEPALWRTGVIAAHASMLLFIALLSVAKHFVERSPRYAQPGMTILSQAAALAYLLHGVTTAVVDQMVTPAITPLLVASTGVAVAIVLRPWAAAINYGLALAIFFYGVSFTQTNPEMLMSARVNSMTAAGLGFGLAVLHWRTQVLAIRQQRRIEEQQRELQAKNRELTLLASRDSLTGLLNRTQFYQDVTREAARMARSGSPACLLLIDIDHFKQVNDTYGHPTGDAILQHIARIMTATVRQIDLLARLGGEEFAVLLPDTSLADAVRVAERLRVGIAGGPISIGAQSVMVTASIGVAPLVLGASALLDDGYRAADRALYQAKADGRNCVRTAAVRSGT
ncbi:MAG TPA: GGDEF domain-containing protein [Symbiobacteriaceae bacterium]|nr:GGDEF domain-containing protein [Symbiobacteriaceae bacterium]